MTTIGQFHRVWLDFTPRFHYLFPTREARDELWPLWNDFGTAFEKQFKVPIHNSHQLPQEWEITGGALEKMRGWILRIQRESGENYLEWCNLN